MIKVLSELGVIAIMITLDRSFLNSSVHSFDMSIGPWMLNLGKTMFNATPIVLSVASFSDIFSGNAVKNGILPVVLPQDAVDRLLEVAREGVAITVDLESQTVTTPFQDRFEFQIDPSLEITTTYGFAKRKESDERRLGQAEGQILRIQAQWNY